MGKLKRQKEAMCTQRWGLILGTLGRQGNTEILDKMVNLLKKNRKAFFILLLSEIFPAKLNQFNNVDVWVQIAVQDYQLIGVKLFDNRY